MNKILYILLGIISGILAFAGPFLLTFACDIPRVCGNGGRAYVLLLFGIALFVGFAFLAWYCFYQLTKIK